MRLRSIATPAALLLILSGPGLSAQAVGKTRRVKTAPSMQSQIDSLKEGQAKLLKELEEIKSLLKAGAGRTDTPAAKPQEIITVNVFGEPFKGDPSARVAIMEYSDFDCSYCARYATEIYPLIDHAYIKGAKVKYFFRDLPGAEHLNAMFKARVARCAGDQNKFWEAHDRLFKDQSPFDAPGLDRFTQALGLDGARFNACLSSDRYLSAIQQSALRAAQMHINGTPAFLIGTLSADGSILTAKKVFLGAESFDVFRVALEELLNPSAEPAK
ncbi:MAG TPA: thioredoxin domain-containing protein [Geothrix sp.]|nr:thioredoxin domain-containing protein [Geothrix sp.]